jgi:hypothetical protein
MVLPKVGLSYLALRDVKLGAQHPHSWDPLNLNLFAQVVPDFLHQPFPLENGLDHRQYLKDELTVAAVKQPYAVTSMPSRPLPSDNDTPKRHSSFPRDAIVSATGSELIARTLRQHESQHTAGADWDDASPSLRSQRNYKG